VFVCTSSGDVQAAARALQHVKSTIFVEQYITAQKNYGIHFGIPAAAGKPIAIFGVNEQITTPEGEFIGGLIEGNGQAEKTLQPVIEHLRDVILPKVRRMGWYGVGGFDVLKDHSGDFYFIDCNFRMTGMTAYHFLVGNGSIPAPLVSFSGTCSGSRAAILKRLVPLTSGPHACLHIVGLSHHDNTWRINGALSFSSQQQMHERISLVLAAGISAPALQQLRTL
jgi:hypothetical protein